MRTVTIRRLADRIGISSDTIRYYRGLGLLKPQQCENGYYEYAPHDALMALYTREWRGRDLSLQSIQLLLEHTTLQDYGGILNEREQALRSAMEMTRLALDRLMETKKYIDCGTRLLEEKAVEIYHGSNTWTCCPFGSEGFENGCLSTWTDYFPFSYVALTISKEELALRHGNEPYCIHAGCGALEKYVFQFQLPHAENTTLHPEGRYVRTCIMVRDPFRITPNDISSLWECAKQNNLVLAGGVGARLLFVEGLHRNPSYSLMIWARVEPEKQAQPLN